MIEKLSKIWAGSIAYVMLLVGGGLSVAGNVADVYRTRGQAVDTLDIVLAAAWPVLVVLTIEGFVSRRWSPRPGFQALRWVGCLAVGSMAMMASWVHLHDLMSSRGQIVAVATGGPLAIDGMAIMATGLLLSTRGQLATLSTRTPATVATPPVDKIVTEDTFSTDSPFEAVIAEWASELDTLDLDMVATQPFAPVSGPPALARSNEIKPASVQATAVEMFSAWKATPIADRPRPSDMYALVGAAHGRDARSARRWWAAVKDTI